MKIKLYLVPGCEDGRLIKKFLEEKKVPFKEVITNDVLVLEKIARIKLSRKVSLVKIRYNRGIGVIVGFNEFALNNQLIKHIKKYKPKIE